MYEIKSRVRDDSKVFGLNNWKDVQSTRTKMKNVEEAGLRMEGQILVWDTVSLRHV